LVAAPAAPLGRTAGRSARGGPARRGLDVQRVSDLRAAVPLVAHVDLVVAPVGPDPPGAEEPAPEPEPPLLGQRPVEQQHVLPPGEVHALALGHAVDVDVERGAHRRRKLHAPAFHRRTDIIKSSMGGRTGTDSSGPAPSEQLGVAPAFTPRPFAAAGWARGPGAVLDAVGDAVDGLAGARPGLVLMFPTGQIEPRLAALQAREAAGGATVAGMTSDGSLADPRGLEPGCSALAFDETVLAGVGVAEHASRDPR